MTQSESVATDRIDGVLVVRLDRPHARNTIDGPTRDHLVEIFRGADADPKTRALVVTGAGDLFCLGGDLSGANALPDYETVGQEILSYRRFLTPFQELFQVYWQLETPVVAAVNGSTAGIGWLLALLADLVVAAEGARWSQAFSKRGMIPHAGDPFFLSRLVPFHKLNELALLGETVTSESLNDWGLVNRLVAPDVVLETALDLAHRLATGPTLALGQTRRLYRRAMESDMATAFSEERDAAAFISKTHDRREGVDAYLARRKPDFNGT